VNWVGIKELRDGLSHFLDDVRKGRTITVTDHGRPVARIVPIDDTSWERLIAEGVVEPAKQRKGPLPDPIQASGTVSDLVHDQRR
jgi:prevent-host-death family protein